MMFFNKKTNLIVLISVFLLFLSLSTVCASDINSDMNNTRVDSPKILHCHHEIIPRIHHIFKPFIVCWISVPNYFIISVKKIMINDKNCKRLWNYYHNRNMNKEFNELNKTSIHEMNNEKQKEINTAKINHEMNNEKQKEINTNREINNNTQKEDNNTLNINNNNIISEPYGSFITEYYL